MKIVFKLGIYSGYKSPPARFWVCGNEVEAIKSSKLFFGSCKRFRDLRLWLRDQAVTPAVMQRDRRNFAGLLVIAGMWSRDRLRSNPQNSRLPTIACKLE